jgi:hypothetical protein
MVTPDKFVDLPDAQRRAIAQECAARLAPLIGGQMAWADDTLEVKGTFNGRPASFKILLVFGTVFVEVQTSGSLLLPFGLFEIHSDPHPGKHTGPDRHYLAPNVYYESTGGKGEMRMNLMRRLPQPAQSALVQTLAQFDRGFFSAQFRTVTLFCPASVTLSPQAAQYVGYYLNLLFNLSNDIDVAWRGAF